jgi:small subunit ribosomal protein S9
VLWNTRSVLGSSNAVLRQGYFRHSTFEDQNSTPQHNLQPHGQPLPFHLTMKAPDLQRGIRAATQCLNRPICRSKSTLPHRLRRPFTPIASRHASTSTDPTEGSVQQKDFKAAPGLDGKFKDSVERVFSEQSDVGQDEKIIKALVTEQYLQEAKDELREEWIQKHREVAKKELLNRIRIVPASPSYFTAKPSFTDDLLSLQTLLRKYQTLPVMPPGQAPRVAWKTLEEYKSMVGSEPVKAARYHRLVELLQRLNYINVELVPEEVTQTLNRYKRAIQPNLNVAKPHYVDHYGRALGIGRRKTSVAKAYVVEGEGEVLVNGKSLTQFFGRVHDRESAIWALKATERISKYNVFALVSGGGTTGQAEAITLAVAKALLTHEPLLKPALRRGMSLTICDFLFLPNIGLDRPWSSSSLQLCSGLRDPRSTKGRTEEAREAQGSQDACLGQALIPFSHV